jgi:pyruvate ferredoxin oxidoreductase gamma subunit
VKEKMREIRIHGRGGQGAVTAGDMIVTAAAMGGEFGSSFPLYGDSRRGGMVVSFVAIDKTRIRQKTKVYTPDCLIVLDSSLQDNDEIYNGVKPDSVMILNNNKAVDKQLNPNVNRVGTVDATAIAMAEIGIPAFNTCILGAFAATTGWVEFDSIVTALGKAFSGEILEKNIRSANRGFKEVEVTTW